MIDRRGIVSWRGISNTPLKGRISDTLNRSQLKELKKIMKITLKKLKGLDTACIQKIYDMPEVKIQIMGRKYHYRCGTSAQFFNALKQLDEWIDNYIKIKSKAIK